MTLYIEIILVIALVLVLVELHRFYNLLSAIYMHLNGIDKRQITAVKDMPESISRSDEEEWLICEQRRIANKEQNK